jgi:hypothetical protein
MAVRYDTRDETYDIGKDPVFCLRSKDTNKIENSVNTITTIEYLLFRIAGIYCITFTTNNRFT